MPIVAHNELPTFKRLHQEGQTILAPDRALQQDIRELHIGLLNMMPDAALEATERQFLRLIGQSNSIAQFYVHPFTFEEQPRGDKAQRHIDQYYESFDYIREHGLDALIITGANPVYAELSDEPFWNPLNKVIDWASENVTSTLCSCLATHAVLHFRHGQKRQPLPDKRWGVFNHRVVDRTHPLVGNVNTRFDVPHSRWNEISRAQFNESGLHVLVESPEGVHLAVSEDGFRLVYFQGHPEYDINSLLKEYLREVRRYIAKERSDYPPFPENYLSSQAQALLHEYRDNLLDALDAGREQPEFPEPLLIPYLDNTWHDTGKAVVGNWMGCIYQITHQDPRIPFMDGVDPNDPLGLQAPAQSERRILV